MHPIHTTPGFIIASRPYGETGKILSIFTRDIGLVGAVAQGIRLEKSKLRYHTQDYSFGTFSFVRGRELWRLTDARDQKCFTPARLRQGYGGQAGENSLLAKVSVLLKRLLHGEEAHPELFDCVGAGITFGSQAGLTGDQESTLESLLVLRILRLLGYIGDNKKIKKFFKNNHFDIELIDMVMNKRSVINQHINKALRESHL